MLGLRFLRALPTLAANCNSCFGTCVNCYSQVTCCSPTGAYCYTLWCTCNQGCGNCYNGHNFVVYGTVCDDGSYSEYCFQCA